MLILPQVKERSQLKQASNLYLFTFFSDSSSNRALECVSIIHKTYFDLGWDIKQASKRREYVERQERADQKLSEIQTEKPQSSDFARALNSMMDNIENVVVNFQKTLLVVLEKVEKLEKLEKLSRTRMASNEKRLYTKEIKQPINDAATPDIAHKESSIMHNENEMTTSTETNLQQDENEISESAPATATTDLKKHDFSKGSVFSVFGKIFKRISSKSNYLILAIVLAVFGVAIIKVYFMLFK